MRGFVSGLIAAALFLAGIVGLWKKPFDISAIAAAVVVFVVVMLAERRYRHSKATPQ